MIIHTLIRLLFSTIEGFSVILLAFAMFRIPTVNQYIKILIISFIISSVSIFQLDYVQLNDFEKINSILFFIILVKFIFDLPLFYALLLCITGQLTYFVIQATIALIATFFHITTIELLNNSIIHGSLLQFASATVTFSIVIWMKRKKLGFMFILNKFKVSEAHKGFNFYISGIILVSIIAMQIAVISFKEHFSLILILFELILLLTIGLYFSYKKNKKDLTDKYERLKKNETKLN